jgi:3-hydroxyisobutyrate dehydrogenase
MRMEPLRQIGFVGLGKMGFPMAGRLAAAGFALKVYDIDPRVQEQFTAVHPAAGCESPADAGRHSDLVITMLPDGRAVRAVALGSGAEDGLAAGMASGSILVDMSSSSPLATRELGKRLASRGIHMLDAPVSGGVSKARDGTLAIMAGGEPEALERCRPVLAAVGERIFFSGPLGSGHAVKALNNMLSAAGFIAAVEVLLVGRRFGVDPKIMNEILNASTGRNNTTENKMEKFVFSRSFSSGFSLDLMVKDLNTAMELARELEAPALFCTACRELWATAQSSLGKGLDHTDVVRWFEDLVHARLGD